MNLPPQLITILIAVPAGILAVKFKEWRFDRLFYRFRPQGKILKTRIKLLTVGDSINYVGYVNGKKNNGSRKVKIDAISDDTITIKFFDEYLKKYIRLLPNGELELLAFEH
jgi:hypothetical protein